TTVFRLDPQTGRVLERFPRAGAPLLPYGVVPYTLAEGPGGTLWQGTTGAGLMRLDPASGRFYAYPFRRTPRAGVSDSLDYHVATSITTDRSGALWIGTFEGGLNRLDVATGRFTSYFDLRRGVRRVTSIHEDRRGRLWFGTQFNGLFLLDRRTGALTNHGPGEGLAYYVHSIVEDAAGMLWLNTPVGITRFDPDRRTFRTFGPRDGMPSTGMFSPARLKSSDGQILFGGTDGLLVFDPRAFSEAAPRPLLSLGALTYRTAGRDSTRGLSGLPRVDLPYDAADVTIAFTGFDYVRPDAVRYQYRMYDGDEPGGVRWSDASPEPSARYASLPAGRFRFEVRAEGADGLWSAPQSVRVVVHPPWWRTWWAYVLYALSVMGLLALLVRAVRHRAQARERERVREEREQAKDRELAQAKEIEKAYTQLKGAQAQLVQQEKLASLGALTAGIAHEIKNPLNFVNNFASLSGELVSDLKDELSADPVRPAGEAVEAAADLFDDLAENARRIQEHGKRADSIIKSMLAHARGSSGSRETVDVNQMVSEYADLAFHAARAQRPGLELRLDKALDPAAGSVEGMPQDLSRVLINLVQNAFQAVDARNRALASGDGAPVDYAPSVRVTTHAAGAHVEIRVWDNGGGIPKTVRERIFEPFFTTKPAGEGTGLGLSLSYDIVAAHGGTLALVTDESAGTTEFTVRLPRNISAAAPQPA
ncbi:MAG TPA: ATP-binding protein, partial [Rhodothermales bacterium]|nr:ATP-binding protein [Rhodothermales bacterium]